MDYVGRRLHFSIGIDTVSVCKIIYVYVYGEWSHVAVKADTPFHCTAPPTVSRKPYSRFEKTTITNKNHQSINDLWKSTSGFPTQRAGNAENMSMSCRLYMQMFLVWFSSSLWVDMQKPWKQISMEMFMYLSCVSFCTKLSTSANGVYDWPRSFVVEERCLLNEP